MTDTNLNQASRPGRSVKFVTLGCKVNQYETQGMKEALAGEGYQELRGAEKASDFVIINTCTVTADADKESRYWIRRMRRENPEAKIVVTGCYVERNRGEVEALEGVDLILSNFEKAEVVERLEAGCGAPEFRDAEETRLKKRTFTDLRISSFQGNGRAFVKIQDGCNHACSFCKVVLVRGRSRSRVLPEIVDEVKRLRDSGYREIVFAGIQLGAYGLDLEGRCGLPEVLEACSRVDGIERLRLSSIEPTDVNPELIEALRGIPKCCPHLHIPLQSGDDEVLKGMNRRYSGSFYRDLIARLKDALPDFALSLDVMAGFPGETRERFENTLRLLEEIRPLKCHVFPYSAREGTRSARFAGEVELEEIRRRVREMISRADAWGAEYRRAYEGRTMDVLVEKKLSRGGLVQGLTANYLKACFQGNEEDVGRVIPVRFLSLQGEVFLARPAANGRFASGKSPAWTGSGGRDA